MFHTITTDDEFPQHLCPLTFRNLITERISQLVELFIFCAHLNSLSCKGVQQWTWQHYGVKMPNGPVDANLLVCTNQCCLSLFITDPPLLLKYMS